ncbi:MAG: redoxin domain-containing protein [Phycisphaerales bacterium]|nr:redoxin domain-containing protein [Phycisphaerales bacterium]MCB9854313.1 redoxin domain-containing protein [Phycisphaerales bacterium]MCB9863514.1 redoxin domain-containing protein [Phycisphaerales bacterium]
MRSRFPQGHLNDITRRTLTFTAGIAVVVSAGCAQQRANDNYAVIRTGERAGDADAANSYAYHYPATAPVLNADELKRFVDEHRNQVVVLEFWASWSSSSRDQIARLAKLHEERRRDGLRVIACTFDEPREWRTHTVPVLQSAGANYPCVVIPRGDRQALGAWLDPAWRFDLPARFIVDRQGTVVARAHGDEAVLAALDSWGSTRTRSRSTYERPAEPRERELRVATATDSGASATTRRETVDSKRDRTDSTRATVTERTSANAGATSSRSPRYASSRRSAATTDRTRSSRYRTPAPETRSRAESTSSPVRTASASTSVGPASTRVKLVNIKTGESEWLPVVSRDRGLDAASDAVASAIRSRIGRATNPRIAVMPFSSMRNRNYSTPLGIEAAEGITASLKREGYYDLVAPTRAKQMVKDAGVTVTQIDFDASVIQDKISADYLVIGWVRNDVDELIRATQSSQPTRIAGDAGISDTGYVSPRREAEDFSDY